MNYEQPRQVDPESSRPDAGKWRWTNYNKRIGTYATGGCGDGCIGHDSEAEAAQHHHEYRLARIRFALIDDEKADSLYRCEVEGCGTHTASQMTIPGEYTAWSMCPAHHTKEAAASVIKLEGASIHS